MNMKNNGKNEAPADNGGGGRPPANFPLARQPSVYSLTFDEFMNTMGGPTKDFGSMNMDELLKNIWTAEEMQTIASTNGGVQPVTGVYGCGGGGGGSYLQKQGSLTLPRTISQKTVDEVWRDISNDETAPFRNFPQQRQQTLGEMTLEEFLVRAGVVREDLQLVEKTNGATFFNHPPQFNNVNDRLTLQAPSNLPLNVNGMRSQSTVQIQAPIMPKQGNMAYVANPAPLMGDVVGGQDVKGNIVPCDENGNVNNNGDSTSSVSPVPYVFNGGFRGRKTNGAVEKVIERRQRRMIKNRESAARSRARKQVSMIPIVLLIYF